MNDEIKNPSHYDLPSGMKAKDVLAMILTPEELKGYWKGCALKYQMRYRGKGKAKDLQKARECLEVLEGIEYGEEA